MKAQEEAIQVLDSKSGWSHTLGDSKETSGLVYSKSTKWGTVYKLEVWSDCHGLFLLAMPFTSVQCHSYGS